MPICWGRRQRVAFSSLGALRNWTPPVAPAVFAVTYQRDPSNKPRAHTVYFFGQSENLSVDANTIVRNICERWSSEGGDSTDLSIFVHSMEGSSSTDRARLTEQLILEYQPVGNLHID